jgi:hypothetical protein
MLVSQAIVSTPSSRALKQNELVSSTDSIDDELAQLLCHWSPQRNDMAYGQSQSINFFQPASDTFAISRSFFGELDSNLDGGRRIVSHFVLFDREQLSGYHNNIALVVHVLRSHGSMLFQTNVPERLPMLEVPELAFVEMGEFSRSDCSAETERIAHAIDIHGEVVILGLKNPIAFLCSFLADFPRSQRLDFSFSTGLKVSNERRYTIQFFPVEEPGLLQDLANRQLRTISLDCKQGTAQARVTGSLNDC